MQVGEIHFKGSFKKIYGQKKAELIDMRDIDVSKEAPLSKDFIEYDTASYEKKDAFKFSDGKYIKLTFLGDKGIPFCTLRKRNIENVTYYSRFLGKEMHIVYD